MRTNRKWYQKNKQREITLTLGLFFDGTANNAFNTSKMLKAYTAKKYKITDVNAELLLKKCVQEEMDILGILASSYTGYYTNIYWLKSLYKNTFTTGCTEIQRDIYIDGVGTEAGRPDSLSGIIFGGSTMGVIAKTDKAVSLLAPTLKTLFSEMNNVQPDYELVIKSLQFDIFGFSRGAAAARHFANRIQSKDSSILMALQEGVPGTMIEGITEVKNRFIGIFDTVAAIGTLSNGMNPHNADSGNVNLTLRPRVAEEVFHITAANECRFNFPLNSVSPVWPELALPGVHSDIGGGYLPVMKEDQFLTRPITNTVLYSTPGMRTHGWYKTVKQMDDLYSFSSIAPILRTSKISAETWYDDRMPQNHYGETQKRSYAAVTLRNRIVKNDWSKVALRVMLDAAQRAGVLFDPIAPTNPDIALPEELICLCEKARSMGRSIISGHSIRQFTRDEIDTIAGKYIHCSAHWNSIVTDINGSVRGGASPSETVGFVHRPDAHWRRTIYNMNGMKVALAHYPVSA